jgi:hypothetical protein
MVIEAHIIDIDSEALDVVTRYAYLFDLDLEFAVEQLLIIEANSLFNRQLADRQ